MCSLILTRLWELWKLFKNLHTLPPSSEPTARDPLYLPIVKKEKREEEEEEGEKEEEEVRGWRNLGLIEENDMTVEAVHNAHFIRWHLLEGCMWKSLSQHGGHHTEGQKNKVTPGRRGAHMALSSTVGSWDRELRRAEQLEIHHCRVPPLQ